MRIYVYNYTLGENLRPLNFGSLERPLTARLSSLTPLSEGLRGTFSYVNFLKLHVQ